MVGARVTLLCCMLLVADGGKGAPGAGVGSLLQAGLGCWGRWAGAPWDAFRVLRCFFLGWGVETTLALTIATAVVMSAPQPSRGTRCLAGLCLCCDIKLLKGLKRQSLSFPALFPFFADITRVSWRSQGTHITEDEKRFTVDYVPRFRGRQFIHPTNLSLKIRPLKLGDNGKYEVVMDTLSDPTKPKTFSYSLRVHGKSKDGGRKVVGTRLGFSPPWACPHGGGLPLCKAPSPEPTHPMTSPPSPGRGT